MGEVRSHLSLVHAVSAYTPMRTGNLLPVDCDEPGKLICKVLFKWTVPQLSIMIIYNCTWSILIQ